MPTNRPFLANFFAAFRAHSALQKASSASSGGVAQSATTSSSSTTTSNPMSPTTTTTRSIATKATAMPIGATTAAMQAAGHLQSTTRRARQASTSPLSTSPGNPNYLGNAMGSTPNPRRRSSSSSGDGGFRDVLGAEKWYIGGIGPSGEERFYRLGMVRRHRSIDRLSLDRLSM